MNWLEGNIEQKPLFIDPENDDFNLQEGSPCIDRGTAFFVWEGDTVINLPNTAYSGNAPDMGAFESPYIVGIVSETGLPDRFTLYQNYPNPFNPVYTIRYELPQASEVSLIVYNILGREVTRLVDGYLEPGYHQVRWDSKDQDGRNVSSGIYIARLVTPEYTKSIKMVLLK